MARSLLPVSATALVVVWRVLASVAPDHPLFAFTAAALLVLLGATLTGAFPKFDAIVMATTTDEAVCRQGWAILLRGLALINLMHALEWATSMRGMVGSEGLWPAQHCLERLRRDYSGLARAQYFPTLLWLTGASDAVLFALCAALAACSLAVLAGSRRTRLLFAVIFAVQLSLSPLEGWWMWTPGEALTFEANLLAAFLPAPSAASAAATGWRRRVPPLSRLPSRFNAFAFRLLCFRVLAGFGKHHFMKSRYDDITRYLAQFLLAMPVPSRLSYLARDLIGVDDAAWGAGYAIYACAECLCPFGFLLGVPSAGRHVSSKGHRCAPVRSWRHAARGIAAAGTVGLMAGIQLSGCFSWFPMLTALLSTTSLLGDAVSCRSDAEVGERSANSSPGLGGCHWRPWAWRACVCGYVALTMSFFVMPSQWLLPVSLYWDVTARPMSATGAAALWLVRVAASWRVAHNYGIFPSRAPSPVRETLVFEVTWDEPSATNASWSSLTYYGQISTPGYVPVVNTFASYLRFDYVIYWQSAMGGVDNPLATAYVPGALTSPMKVQHRVARAILRGGAAAQHVGGLFESVPGPPHGLPPTTSPVAIRGRMRKFLHPRAFREAEQQLGVAHSTEHSVPEWWVELPCESSDPVALKYWRREADAGKSSGANACVVGLVLPPTRRSDVDEQFGDKSWLVPPAAMPNLGGFAEIARTSNTIAEVQGAATHSAWKAFWGFVGDAHHLAAAPASDRAQYFDIASQLSAIAIRAMDQEEHCREPDIRPICQAWAAECMVALGEKRFTSWLRSAGGDSRECNEAARATLVRIDALETAGEAPFYHVINQGVLGSLDRWDTCYSNVLAQNMMQAANGGVQHFVPIAACTIPKAQRTARFAARLADEAALWVSECQSQSGMSVSVTQ
jgi:hypothetical protein